MIALYAQILLKNHRAFRSSIPCPSCRHLIHKKCSNLNSSQLSNLKSNTNIWECPTCMKLKFSFSELEDDEIYLSSFNSNWSCNCGNHRPGPSYKDKYITLKPYSKNLMTKMETPFQLIMSLMNNLICIIH